MRYLVAVGYRDDDDTHWIGRNVYEAADREEAIRRAMDEFWDGRLDAASCTVVTRVKQISLGRDAE